MRKCTYKKVLAKSSFGISKALLSRTQTAKLPENSLQMCSIRSLVNLTVPNMVNKYNLCELLPNDCISNIRAFGLKSEQECYCVITHILWKSENIVLGYGRSVPMLDYLCTLCTAQGSKPDISAYYSTSSSRKDDNVSRSHCTPKDKSIPYENCEVCRHISSMIKETQFQVYTNCNNGIIISAFEHHSKDGDCVKSFCATIRQAAYIGIDILRVLLSYDDDDHRVTNYTVYYFPTNDDFTCVVAITVTFNIMQLLFDCTCEILEKDKVAEHVETVIKKQSPVCKYLLNSNCNEFYLNTIVRVDQGNMKNHLLTEFRSTSYFKQWKNMDILQYQSSSSFVFLLSSDDQEVFAKWFVHMHSTISAPTRHKHIRDRVIEKKLDHSPVYDLLDTVIVCGREFLIYPCLLGPLSRSDVKKCFTYFLNYTVTVLKDLHSLGYAHQDVRLENICFVDNPIRAVLIDIDTVCFINERSSISSEMAKESCLYAEGFNPIQTDWRQLGCMAIWVLFEDEDIMKGVETIHGIDLNAILTSDFSTKSVINGIIVELIKGKLCIIK